MGFCAFEERRVMTPRNFLADDENIVQLGSKQVQETMALAQCQKCYVAPSESAKVNGQI